MKDIKQFKLTSGEEIICDVLEYPDDEMADIVIRNAYVIFIYGQTPDGIRTYSMRPWMMMQEESDNMVILNSNHVVGEANPTEKLIEHYAKVMMHDRSTEKDSDGMVEKLANYIKHLREIANAGTDLASDSDAQGNIVKFPGRILH